MRADTETNNQCGTQRKRFKLKADQQYSYSCRARDKPSCQSKYQDLPVGYFFPVEAAFYVIGMSQFVSVLILFRIHIQPIKLRVVMVMVMVVFSERHIIVMDMTTMSQRQTYVETVRLRDGRC